MVRAIVKRSAPLLWCVLLLLTFGWEESWAQETPATAEPGGIIYAAWGILITIFVLIPIGSTWLCSHFVMEDDRLRFSLMLYAFYVVLFALTTVALFWVEEFAVDDRWLAGVSYAVILALFVVALVGIPMKVYYAAIYRAVALLVFTVVCMAAALVGTIKSLDGLPAGDKFNEMFGGYVEMAAIKGAWMRAGLGVYGLYDANTAQSMLANAGIETGSEIVTDSSTEDTASDFPEIKMKPKSETAQERPAPKIYSSYSTPPEEKKTEEPKGRMMEEVEKPKPTALAQPAESEPSGPKFEVGQKVAMLRELTIPTDYGDLKIRKGDEVNIIRAAGPGEWIVKRGVMQFRVQESDLRELR